MILDINSLNYDSKWIILKVVGLILAEATIKYFIPLALLGAAAYWVGMNWAGPLVWRIAH